MSWYLAPSLARLRSQVARRWPNRSTVSDGTKGDSAHASRDSDHNPDPKTGVVRAIDFTVNSAQGNAILKAAWNDPRVFYVIWRKKIYYRGESKPRPYAGLNAHVNHIHISIDRTKSAETNTALWEGVGLPYMVSPMEGRFTSGFNLSRYITLNGKRVFSPHGGIDIAPPTPGTVGTPVYATLAGTVEGVVHGREYLQPATKGPVVWRGYSGNGGRVRNPDGEQQLYIHVNFTVKNGTKVKPGDLLGYTDTSGIQTGPHLHISFLTVTGVEYDPLIVFDKHGVTPGEAPILKPVPPPLKGIPSMKHVSANYNKAKQPTGHKSWKTLDVKPAKKNGSRIISFTGRNPKPALAVARAHIQGLGADDFVDFIFYHLKYDPKNGNGPASGILRKRVYGAPVQGKRTLISELDMTRVLDAVPAGHRWRVRAQASKSGVTVSNLRIDVFE